MRNQSSLRLRILPLGILLFFAGFMGLGFAQRSTTSLSGTVTDSSGALIPNAKVEVTSLAEGFARTGSTNNAGEYLFPDLTPGAYNISVEVQGFKKALVSGIKLYVGQPVTQDFHLEVGTVAQSVTVQGTPPLLNQTTATVGTVMESNLITALPLNGRNFMELPRLSPGASWDVNRNTFDSVQINPTAQSFNVDGQRGDYNQITLDDTLITEWQHGSNTFSPSVDAVQEFQVSTSNYSAAEGSESAAHVNLVTKSGTNSLHGDAYEFLRNSALDSRYWQAASLPPFRRNQFGGTAGGPLDIPKLYSGKDKTFFFASYEGFRQWKGIIESGLFPTAAQLGGNLSTVATSANPVIDPTTGAGFLGNIVPQNRMPANLLNFLQNGIGNGPWLPLPNITTPTGAYNYQTSSPDLFNNDQFMARIDQKVGNKTFLYGRYAFNNAALTNPNLNPNWQYIQTNRTNSVAFHESTQLRPNLLWDITFGWSRFHQNEYYTTAYKNNIVSELGIKGLSTIGAAWGAPSWGVTGYSSFGEVGSAPRAWKPNVIEFHPGFSWIQGNHSVKFGMDFYRVMNTFPEALVPDGSFGFNGQFTNYPLADFLLGLPNSVDVSTTPFDGQYRYSMLNGYFQDDWKVTPHLVLNLGLRYEWKGTPYSANRSASDLYLGPNNAAPQLYTSKNLGPITFDGVKQALLPGVSSVTAKSLGLPDYLIRRDDRNIGPRIGFAYTLPKLSNTVLRGGYGFFYQRDTDNAYVDLGLNPPFIYSAIYSLNSSNINQFNWFDPTNGASLNLLGYYCLNPEYRTPRTQQWNLTMEHTHWGSLFSLAYVGNVSEHLPSFEEPNQARPGPGSFASRERWPNSPFFFWQSWNGISNYNGLQAKFQKTFARGFTLLSGFTWSRALDNTDGTFVGEGAGGSASIQDSYNSSMNYGLSTQDAPKRFFAAYLYELPVGRGKHFLNQGGAAAAVLGGWQVNGITTAQSGNPVYVQQACNRANTNGGSMRPDLLHNPNDLPGGRSHAAEENEWFDTSAFVNVCPGANGPFSWGNAGRNLVRGPGIQDWDFGVAKNIPLGAESRHLEFRAEFFNLLNHPIFSQPGSVAGTSSFGVIYGTSVDPRQIQFALKLNF